MMGLHFIATGENSLEVKRDGSVFLNIIIIYISCLLVDFCFIRELPATDDV